MRCPPLIRVLESAAVGSLLASSDSAKALLSRNLGLDDSARERNGL